MLKQTVILFVKALVIGIVINFVLIRNADRPSPPQNVSAPEQFEEQTQPDPSNVKVQFTDETNE
jgi:hypothetical protein